MTEFNTSDKHYFQFTKPSHFNYLNSGIQVIYLVFLVAEIGVNWDGDLELVKSMMSKAKETGFDAIKFQAYNENMIKDHPLSKRLMKSAITKNNIENINTIAKSVGIEWFCTPMYPEAVDLLEPFVNKFKIRVADGRSLFENSSSKLINKILESDKEIIVSVEKNPKISKFSNNQKINWLYCVPKYPCSLSDLDFRDLNKFDGYSNHCRNILAPLIAVALGAEIIEVHVTSDKSKDFIDNPVSFDYSEQLELCTQIRNCEKIQI
jgi:N,N'-diacetyllegionaminate synthase